MAKAKKAGIDVASPGDSPAEATSRPVIINKGPALRDPMVTKEETTITKTIPPPSTVKKKIEPLQHTDAAESTDSTDPTVNNGTAEVTVDEPELKTDKDASLQTPEDILAKEDQKRQELADKLIAQKKYFVPIGAVHQRQTNQRITAFLLICLVVLIAAVAAVDAELVETNITLPFDLIK